jgi:polar amino acid transport system substrate-binding protein
MRHLISLACLLSPLAWAKPPLVLVTDPWCPVACEVHSARPGYLVEIAKAVFEPAGYQVDYQIVPFSRAEVMINQGEASAFLGVLKLPKRRHWVFPTTAQAMSRVCFYTRPDSQWTYRGDESLRQLRLGTIRGYSYGAEIDAKLVLAKTDMVSGTDALRRGIAKLNAGRVDALVEYELIAQYQSYQQGIQLRNAGCGQSNDALYIAFSPLRADAPELAKLLDQGIQTLRENGQLKKILQRYGISDWQIKR